MPEIFGVRKKRITHFVEVIELTKCVLEGMLRDANNRNTFFITKHADYVTLYVIPEPPML